MLVADALDVVLAIAVVEQGRAFQGLHHGDGGAQALFQIIAGRQRAGRAGGGDKGARP